MRNTIVTLSLAAVAVVSLAVRCPRPACGRRRHRLSRSPTSRRQSGVTFRHTSGAFGKKYLPETMGSGVVVLDVDNDGLQDLFFANGKSWPGRPPSRSLPALYRNAGGGRFTDITRAAGLAVEMYGMGATAGDYDNDGAIDLFVTALGGNRLFRNTGKGTFQDVTQRAGVGRAGFSTSAAWLDYDKDGRLDLFVTNYVQWQLEKDIHCTLDGKTKSYCTPESYKGDTPFLFRNLGNGTFEDATKKAGLNDPTSKGLGIGLLDFNGDGWIDIFVANDTQPNRLYRNTGKGTFVDDGGDRWRRVQRSRRGTRRHGRGRRRLRRLGTPGPADRQLLQRDAVALPQRGQRPVHRRRADVEPRPRVAADAHVRVLLLRRRQRRAARHLHGQRPCRRRHQPRAAEGDLRAAGAPVPQRGQGPLPGRRRGAFRRWRSRSWRRGAAHVDIDNDGDQDLVVTTNNGPARVLRNDSTGGRAAAPVAGRREVQPFRRRRVGAGDRAAAPPARRW